MTLITGATGFVGKAVARELMKGGHVVVATTRHGAIDRQSIPKVQCDTTIWRDVGQINKETPWQTTLAGVKVVVHCAARVHVLTENAINPLGAYREVNVEGTLHLARMAAAAGVQRFVFLSSVGVNGNKSIKPFTEDDEPNPMGAYAISKLEAERGLFAFARDTDMEIVVIRSPLVYGPNAPGSFRKLLDLLESRIPLPLGGVRNLRSLVAIDNLVSLIVLCADRNQSPRAANQVFLVADARDLSTTELIKKIGQAADCSTWLYPVPTEFLRAFAGFFGKHDLVDRLLSDLQIDTSKARAILGWEPVVSLEDQLAVMFPHDVSRRQKSKIRSSRFLRWLDIFFSGLGILLLWPLIIVLYIVSFCETGVPLLRQERMGFKMRPFMLVKFRTMRMDTPHVASHLANSAAITPLGGVIRRTKLDELPQLWNVLLGDMSLVGPRPCLLNQTELIDARAALGVYSARPGITGLAQVTGVDMSTPLLLAQTDSRMLAELTILSYFKYLGLTVLGKGGGDRLMVK